MELRDELEVEGHVVMYQVKSRDEWLAQARKAMLEAEAYGAKTPNQMHDSERALLRDALRALGVKVEF